MAHFCPARTMSYQFLTFEVVDRIATITVNRPDKLNALNDATIQELGRAIDEARSRDDVGGVLLTGAGRAFVAGADLSELDSQSPLDATMRLRIVSVVKAPGSNQATLTVQGRAGVPLKLQAAGSVAGLADVGDVTLTGGVAPWFFTTTTVPEIHGAEAYRVYRLRVGP